MRRSTTALQPILSCFECVKAVTTIQGLKKHVTIHTGENPYSCEVGNKAFRSSYNLKEHKNIHKPKDKKKPKEKFMCDQCSTDFQTRPGLLLHKLSIHEKVRYDCDQCDYKATQRASITKHTLSAHEGVKFICDLCGYKETTKKPSYKAQKGPAS